MARNFWLSQREQRWYPITLLLEPKVRGMAIDVLENQEQYNDTLVLDPLVQRPLKELLSVTAVHLVDKMSGSSFWKTKEVDVTRNNKSGFAFRLKVSDYLHADSSKRAALCEKLANDIWQKLKTLSGQGITYTFYNLIISGQTIGLAAWNGK